MRAAFAMPIRYVLLALALFAAAPLSAQQAGSAGQTEGQNATGQSAESRGEALEQAYKKEFAFLAAQKRDLQQRLEAFKARAGQERQAVQREIDQLQGQVVRLTNEADRLQEQIREAEQAARSNQDNQQVLEATFQQAEVTLEEHGVELLGTDGFAAMPEEDKIRELFTAADQVTDRLGSVRETEGSFFLADGTKVDGTIIKIGAIAAYGISDQAAGALAPAGGGRFKLWPAASGETARALASGDSPEMLPMFLSESLNHNVETDSD
jgi:biopolymer transport protein ExbB